MVRKMADEKVSISDALQRIIDAFVMEQGSMYEHYIRKHLPGIADRIEKQMPMFGWEIVAKTEAPAAAAAPKAKAS